MKTDYSEELGEIRPLVSFENIEVRARLGVIFFGGFIGYLVLGQLILLIYICLVTLTAFNSALFFKRYPNANSRNFYMVALLNDLISSSVFTILPLHLWFIREIDPDVQDLYRMSAVMMLSAAMIHSFLQRSMQFPLTVTGTAPMALAFLSFPISFYTKGNAPIAFLTFIVVLSLLAYFIMSIYQAFKRHQLLKETIIIANEANQAKSDFLATVSHELRTPLNGIVGLVEVLQKTPNAPETPERLKILAQSTESLNAIVDDVLDISRAEKNELILRPSPSHLRDDINDAVEFHRGAANTKGTKINVRSVGVVPSSLVYDSQRLRQILDNMLSNAVKFTFGGTIEVALNVGQQGDKSCLVTINVQDSGIGIHDSDLPRLFDRFFQTKSNSERGRSGFGLGLAISRELARRMGGTITATSKLGKGSDFELTFKADHIIEDTIVTAPVVVEQPRHDGRRILVVDDTPTNRFTIRALLEIAGYSVDEVEGGRDAISACQTTDYDVVLMDIQMPDMDGIETFRHLQNKMDRPFNTPVIAVTAQVGGGERDYYIDLGMEGYVPKPVKQSALIEEIEAALTA
jgi:signal transduction histidine kinase/CheY-like chemotaxis protein